MGAIIPYNESNFLVEVNKTFDCIFSVEKRRNIKKKDKFIKFYKLEQRNVCLIITADSLFLLTVQISEHNIKCLQSYKQKYS